MKRLIPLKKFRNFWGIATLLAYLSIPFVIKLLGHAYGVSLKELQHLYPFPILYVQLNAGLIVGLLLLWVKTDIDAIESVLGFLALTMFLLVIWTAYCWVLVPHKASIWPPSLRIDYIMNILLLSFLLPLFFVFLRSKDWLAVLALFAIPLMFLLPFLLLYLVAKYVNLFRTLLASDLIRNQLLGLLLLFIPGVICLFLFALDCARMRTRSRNDVRLLWRPRTLLFVIWLLGTIDELSNHHPLIDIKGIELLRGFE